MCSSSCCCFFSRHMAFSCSRYTHTHTHTVHPPAHTHNTHTPTHTHTHTHTHTQSGSQPARQELANQSYTFIWPQDGGTPSLLPSSVPTAGVGFSPSLSLTRSLHLSLS